MKPIFTIALLAATLAVSALGAEDLYLVTLRSEAAVDRLATVAEQIAVSYGGTVVEVDAVGGTMLMHLPAARVATAERDPRVQSIRPAGAPRIATGSGRRAVCHSQIRIISRQSNARSENGISGSVH